MVLTINEEEMMKEFESLPEDEKVLIVKEGFKSLEGE